MIISAAIKKDDQVYTGHRHHNIINRDNHPELPFGFFKKGEQGFVDDKGNFLNREDAAKHALECGQISKLKFSATELFSEDLY